jgi:hypothetical protein
MLGVDEIREVNRLRSRVAVEAQLRRHKAVEVVEAHTPKPRTKPGAILFPRTCIGQCLFQSCKYKIFIRAWLKPYNPFMTRALAPTTSSSRAESSPRTVLIDAKGKIGYDAMGSDENELRTEIAKLGPEYEFLSLKPKHVPCVASK